MTQFEHNIESPLYLGTHWRERRLPTVLTIAGSDNSGGAGIEADIKSISAQGCYAMTCITALTCQTPEQVYSSISVEESHIRSVLQHTFQSMRCDSVKIGMLTYEALKAVTGVLETLELDIPVVLDPVMVATSGAQLSSSKVWDSQEMGQLLQKVSVLTPNIPEAKALLGVSYFKGQSTDDFVQLAKQLKEKCKCNVLLKGGHMPLDGKIVDVLCYNDEVHTYFSEELTSTNLHGTGCTLSSTIASRIARGEDVPVAVQNSIQYVHNAILTGEHIEVTARADSHSATYGPLNHVYELANSGSVANGSGKHQQVGYETMLQIPEVKKAWHSYIDHEFVARVSNGTIDMDKFAKYLRQDYHYLQTFARIHAKLAADATTETRFQSEVAVLQNIIHEMEKQERILGPGIKTNVKSQEMLDYTNYLKEVAQYGNWEQLYTATMPCCLGYVIAVRKIQDKITVTEDSHPKLYQWLQEYLREDFYQASQEGIKTLDSILKQSQDPATLVKIFKEVCDLETRFWDQGL